MAVPRPRSFYIPFGIAVYDPAEDTSNAPLTLEVIRAVDARRFCCAAAIEAMFRWSRKRFEKVIDLD